MEEIDQEKHPLIIISTLGRVSNGKTSLIKALTGKSPMKYSKEMKKNMTIKLGFTNIKFYKCELCYPLEYYKVNEKICKTCNTENKLILNTSWIDNPGHSDLMETALSGISNVDFCVLVLASDCENDLETGEHYKAIKILELENSTIILHNKLDLIKKEIALENYNKIKETYDAKYILPTCIQFGYGLKNAIKLLVESIPNPINENLINKINLPLKASIIRSFDVNKPGTKVDDISGSVIGVVIKTGYLKINDIIKIIPGIISSNGSNFPIEAKIISLKTDDTELDIAYPGSLIGIGLSIDPALSKEDRLVGNFIVNNNNKTNKIFKKCTIKFNKLEENLKLKNKDLCTAILSSIKRIVKINKIDNDNNTITITSMTAMAGELEDSIIIIKSNHIEVYGKLIEIE
jgi:translation initiation factor 2 subunit 3